MNMTKGTRIILLSIAALLIAGALLLNASITEKHPYSGAAKTLQGSTAIPSMTMASTTQRFSGIPPYRIYWRERDLSRAVAASIEGGFPSDINARI